MSVAEVLDVNMKPVTFMGEVGYAREREATPEEVARGLRLLEDRAERNPAIREQLSRYGGGYGKIGGR